MEAIFSGTCFSFTSKLRLWLSIKPELSFPSIKLKGKGKVPVTLLGSCIRVLESMTPQLFTDLLTSHSVFVPHWKYNHCVCMDDLCVCVCVFLSSFCLSPRSPPLPGVPRYEPGFYREHFDCNRCCINTNELK